MSPYRVVVLDLDDTLLRDDLTISPRTRDSLARAQKQGVVVVLASGRPTGAIWLFARELGLPEHGGWILSFNGAVVTECSTGKPIFQQALPWQIVHELHDLATARGAGILTYVDDAIVPPHENPWTEVEHKLTGLPVREVPDFKAAVSIDPIKAIVVDEPTRLKETALALAPRLEGRVHMALSKPFFLEFTANGIDKRHSLELLLKRLGLAAAETIAIGDSYNDLGMIALAGLGVCMANGPEEVRHAADHVTASNMEDGVALVVERFVLGDPVA